MGYLRKANLKDLNYVCENMREMDRLEAVYQTGQEPADALRLTYLAGEQVLTIASDDDQPMGLCEVIRYVLINYLLIKNIKYNL